MKKIIKFIIISFLVVSKIDATGQSATDTEILNLSKQIFTWEVENKIDSLAGILSDKFSVVTSRGDIQTKQQYLATLGNGNIKHDSIAVEQSIVTLINNTATVTGKGRFHITAAGNKLHRHLSYMEVFVKEDERWKLMALYASVLPE